MIPIKSTREITLMREAGRIVALALDTAEDAITPGITTKELDNIICETIRKHNAEPSFLGYRQFPASACISINNELIHGIPGKRKLREGDIVSIDVGACFQGYHADAADTFPVGTITGGARHLIDVAQHAFWSALLQCKDGKRLSDIEGAIEDYARAHGVAIVEAYSGHGIGAMLHEDPEIVNFRTGKKGPRLRAGMALAIEPMFLAGATGDVYTLDDGWTVVSDDGSLAAHYEHTVLITDGEPEVLTRRTK